MKTTLFRVTSLLAGLLAAGVLAQPRVPYFALSGDLRDSVGNPVTTPTDLVVRLYDSSAAPVTTALHVENFPATPVTRGQFQLQVGTTVALQQARLFNRPDGGAELWVGVQVAGEGEMSPRLRVNSAPWALSVDWSGLTGVPAPSCPAGQYVRSISAAGVATCAVDANSGGTVTSVATGAGLSGGPISVTGTIGLAATVQNWTAGQPTCAGFIRSIGATGTATCGTELGTVSSITAGAGLTGGVITTAGTIGLGTVPVANGGTGSTTQNFVDLTTNQSIAGSKNFTTNVGIGVPAPANELAISATNPAVQLISTAANYGSLYFYEGATLMGTVQSLSPTYATASRRGALELYNNSPNGPVSLFTNATERVRVEPGGQVGMTLSSPDGGASLRVTSNEAGPNGVAQFENSSASAATFSTGISVTDNGGGRSFELDLAGSATTMPVFANHVGFAVLNSNGTPGIDIISNNPTGMIRLFPAGILGTEGMRITSTGRVGIGITGPAAALDVQTAAPGLKVGATCVSGSCPSDRRLKENIHYLTGSLSQLERLKPASYRYRADPTHRTGFGLIAQDVEQVMPELVETDAKGIKSVHYEQLPFLTLESVKELKAQADVRDAKLQSLEKENRALRERLAAIERKLGLRPWPASSK